MSLKKPSYTTTNRTNSDIEWNGIKTRFEQSLSPPHPNNPTDRVKRTETSSSPKAALAIRSKYIATLHIGLVTFLGDLNDNKLHHYVNYFLRNVQYQESRLNVNYVPNAIKQVGLTFQSLEEVKDSKGYKAVLDLYIADEEATKSRWTEYHNEIDNLTHLGLQQQFQTSLCTTSNTA